jgi:hypothetical protein
VNIDTSLGYEHYIDILASIIDNPLDSIHNGRDVTEAIALAFDKTYAEVRGSAYKIFLFDSKKGNWEIVS